MSRLVIRVIIVLLGFPTPELLLKLGFVSLDTTGYVLEGQVVRDLRQLHVDVLRLRNFEGIDVLVLGFDLVFATPDVDNLGYVQTFDQIVRHDIRRSNDDIIYVLHCERHQNSLLQALQRVLISSVVFDQLVVPESDVQVVSLLLRRLEPSDHTRMH